MEFENIKELINLVDSSSLAFFELESGNDHIKMDKSLSRGLSDNNSSSLSNANGGNNVDNINTSLKSVEKSEIHVEKNEDLKGTEKEIVIEDKNTEVITSPMVGTFYSSASPESPAFAEVGNTVSKGNVICIIEAMKLMNEIESDFNGIIVERLVNDGDMVEYGQPLFKIKGE
ncbi:acetyl-CoA carboxylase biotin carboxyl carrier protein [Clostridium beijerinckii]|nr:acetyl-CoA carboxylase biotin carboxyl carrier protein [Clostridium beijerinckii]